MTTEISQQDAEKVLRGVTIPPRPAILMNLNTEIKKANPDLRIVSNLISGDVALYASMLKAVNSPFFGLRTKIASASQAVQVLGLNNVKSIVTGLVLRNSIPGERLSLERFWDSAEKVASISAYLGTVIPKAPRDESYTFGLFRDCGIPLLMQRFGAEYMETLKLSAGQDKPMIQIEDERHGTSHVVVGHMVAKIWGLPEEIVEAILRHHDPTVFDFTDHISPTARTLVAMNFLAEHLHETQIRMRVDPQWESVGEQTLTHLGIDEDEFEDLKYEIQNMPA